MSVLGYLVFMSIGFLAGWCLRGFAADWNGEK